MEEEGEEDDVKKRRKPPLLPKPKLNVINDKTAASLSRGRNLINRTKPPISKKPSTDSNESSASSSTERQGRTGSSDRNLPQNQSIKSDKESSETSESESSDEDNADVEESQDNCSKVGKSVSFSPSTEFLDHKLKTSVGANDSEEVSTLSQSSGDLIEQSTSEEVDQLDTSEAKIQDDAIKNEKNKVKEALECEKADVTGPSKSCLDSSTEEDDSHIEEADDTQTEQITDMTPPTSPSENVDVEPSTEKAITGVSSDVPEDGIKDIPPSDEESSLNTSKETSELKTKVDSPILPPRNANGTSPATPPKPDPNTLSKKGLGSPIISAMKKMVEAPINFIKSKKDSKSPTRKEKLEIGPPILIPKSEADAIFIKPKDDTGSPPLPPRNKTDAGSPSLLIKNNNGLTGSPILPFKIQSVGESPKLNFRNKMETAFMSSPKTDQITEKELENLPMKNYILDDPKRFCSLQVKRNNNGNGRVRESSLPPPTRTNEDGRKSPKVPPKTWMWEELRRNKVKGGYPWTHLYKGSFDEAKWKEIMEHEYEYVDPRPELLRPEPVRPQVSLRVTPSPEPEKPKQQRRFIRIRDTDQVIIPLHGSSDEEHNPDRYDDPALIGQEEIGLTPPAFHPSPSPSPSRRKGSPEPKLSEKLRTTAGQIGSKIRKISIPDKSKIRLPDKPKFISDIQQIKLPDRPKFLSEKPKFLTEKPKFLTEKPKFLTEKPKFLTEKPKFLTEKPKFLTEKPKFLTEKPKFLTEKPKFLTERPKFLTEKPKFLREGIKFPDRPKISMPTISLPKPRRSKTKRETSVKSEFGSEKNIFHTIKARTYPRFLNKKKKLGSKKATPPPPGQAKFDSESLPSTPRSKRNDKWTEVYKEKKVDDEGKVASYANGESFHERYSKREAKRASSSSIVDSDREQASSGSSTQRHRAGVIEEIDSDEFFVRVKGISREDVQVSRYLSSEIREAFRSPKNALASLDKEDFDDEEPLPPHRSKKPKEYPRKEFNTFPLRPSRSKKGNGTMEKPPRRFRSKAKPSSLPSLDRDREFDMDIEEAVPASKGPPMPPKRRKSAKDLASEDHWITTEFKVVPDEGMALDEMKVEYDIPPVAPVRKARSRGTSLADEDRTSRGAESIKSEMQMEDELNDDLQMEDELGDKEVREIVAMTPGFALNESSIPLEKSTVQESPAYSNVFKSRPPRPPLPPQQETEKGKTLPHHRLKSKLLGSRHVQQLQSWKNQGVHFFFTYPRKAMNSISRTPKRPVRNYSTISGPTRPPRRHKVFREPVYVDADIELTDSIPFIDEDEKLKSSRSDEAIGGMKGRPLPPPPRPPSPSKELDSTDKEPVKSEAVSVLNNLAGNEPVGESISLDMTDRSAGKFDDVTDKLQSRPLPPPPRKKRGSTSTERKRESISEEANILNDLDRKEAIDARMTIDISEPISIVSVHHVEPIKVEDKVTKAEAPVRQNEETLRKATAEISQQTSLEVAEITVSVQTDPLPEGVIVEDSEELTSSCKQHESDEEPTIEKYLEKYGSEIKMLGRQLVTPKPTVSPEVSKPQPTKPTPEQLKAAEIIENIEREIIPSNLSSAESEKNINKSETKVIEKVMPIEKEPKKEEKAVKESTEARPIDVPISLPDRLHLSHLDVDNLNVTSLKASQILVSDLSGQSIQVAELTSRGGNLVVSGMEFPPNFVQSLASEISAKVEEKIPQRVVEISQPVEVVRQQEEKPAESQLSPHRPQKLTVVTAPPTVVVQPSAESFKPPTPEVGKLSSSDNIPTPRTTRNKGKKSIESSRIVDDSEDELASSIQASSSSRPSSSRASPVRQIGPPSQPLIQPAQSTGTSGLSARQLLVELLKIWKDCMSEGFSACSNTVGAMFPEGNKRRDAQTAACVLFVIIIGLFALGFGTDNTVHYHHWDFVPPRV